MLHPTEAHSHLPHVLTHKGRKVEDVNFQHVLQGCCALPSTSPGNHRLGQLEEPPMETARLHHRSPAEQESSARISQAFTFALHGPH